MLGRLLHIFGSVHVACEILILFGQISQRFMKSSRRIEDRINALPDGIEDRISALPDDLLVRILSFFSTKEAVTTMILSNRWRYIWKMMVPTLKYVDSDYRGKKESIWWFLDESLQHHKAPVLKCLVIELGPRCPAGVNVGQWIANAIDRKVITLGFKVNWLANPTSLPEKLYICNTLVDLSISDKIFVDVPSLVCLPSLKFLSLICVVYKDDDSLVRLLSGCHNLKHLHVERHNGDNVTKFNVKVPSLKTFCYEYVKLGQNNMEGSLVIDSASLTKIFLMDISRNSCSIENKPRLDKGVINVLCYPDDKFLSSFSSVMDLILLLSVETVRCCKAINFSQLIVCKIIPYKFDWLEPFMCLLQNSPKLKVLLIDQPKFKSEDFPLSFNPPSSVPRCLSSHLEIFEWIDYGGRNEEKEVVRYILANSKCLKKVGISIKPTSPENDQEKITELESMSRVSTSSQLLFSTQLDSMLYLSSEWRD